MANVSNNFYTAFYNHIKKLNFIVTVSKDDTKNPKMGTKENPIPVFKVVGGEKPIRIWHDDENRKTIYENYDITQVEFENSVNTHLK